MKQVGAKRELIVTTPSDFEIAMTRVFDAPRHLVWDAFTKPELLQRWLFGPDNWSMPTCSVDLRVGGAYRYEMRNADDGMTMGLSGVYREVTPPERIVQAERFDEPWYPGEGIVTTTFTEDGGSTTVTMTVRYESREARDLVLQSGMSYGVGVSYDRLAGILAKT